MTDDVCAQGYCSLRTRWSPIWELKARRLITLTHVEWMILATAPCQVTQLYIISLSNLITLSYRLSLNQRWWRTDLSLYTFPYKWQHKKKPTNPPTINDTASSNIFTNYYNGILLSIYNFTLFTLGKIYIIRV